MGAFFLSLLYSEQDINASDPEDHKTETIHAAIIATRRVKELNAMEHWAKVVAGATVIAETLSTLVLEVSVSPYTFSEL